MPPLCSPPPSLFVSSGEEQRERGRHTGALTWGRHGLERVNPGKAKREEGGREQVSVYTKQKKSMLIFTFRDGQLGYVTWLDDCTY